MHPALVAFLATTAVIAGLVGLLRLAKAGGERLARAGADQPPVAPVPPPVAPGPGYLSAEEQSLEQWAADATQRDLDRIAAAHRVFQHGSNRLFERALAQLRLNNRDRNWTRLFAGNRIVEDR